MIGRRRRPPIRLAGMWWTGGSRGDAPCPSLLKGATFGACGVLMPVIVSLAQKLYRYFQLPESALHPISMRFRRADPARGFHDGSVVILTGMI